MVRQYLANAFVASGRLTEANDEYIRIAGSLTDNDERLFLFQRNLTWALPSIALGDSASAERRLAQVHRRLRARIGDDSYESAEALALLGAALSAQGKSQEALENFERAVPHSAGTIQSIGW